MCLCVYFKGLQLSIQKTLRSNSGDDSDGMRVWDGGRFVVAVAPNSKLPDFNGGEDGGEIGGDGGSIKVQSRGSGASSQGVGGGGGGSAVRTKGSKKKRGVKRGTSRSGRTQYIEPRELVEPTDKLQRASASRKEEVCLSSPSACLFWNPVLSRMLLCCLHL